MKIDTKQPDFQVKVTQDDAFIMAKFFKDKGSAFDLRMHGINGEDIFNMMSHMAIALEQQSDITIKDIAARLVEDQGNFKQTSKKW